MRAACALLALALAAPHSPHARRAPQTLPPSLEATPLSATSNLSVLALHIEPHRAAPWHVPEAFASELGRRTNVSMDSLACHLRLYAVTLEAALGTLRGDAVLQLRLTVEGEAALDPLYCHASSSLDTDADFRDAPRTAALAFYCPVSLQQELGPTTYRSFMPRGRYCAALAACNVSWSVALRPSLADFFPAPTSAPAPPQLAASLSSAPQLARLLAVRRAMRSGRAHGVCIVQNFRNELSGPMLFLAVSYWQRLGWAVIVYDRSGAHRRHLRALLGKEGVFYHPHTALQLALPRAEDEESAPAFKFYYEFEHPSHHPGTLADTASMDSDKTKTYNLARVEFAHLASVLFVDADELLVCPEAGRGLAAQRAFQQSAMDALVAGGVQEERFAVLVYAAKGPSGEIGAVGAPSLASIAACMTSAFEGAGDDLRPLLRCWSDACVYFSMDKSADLGSVCPFRYNHWSCDGGRGGGRARGRYAKAQCACRVGFSMRNGYSYVAQPDKCHLAHLNHFKFEVEALRPRARAVGNASDFNVIARMGLAQGRDSRETHRRA